MQKKSRFKRGVKKEIKYFEPCSNAKDKAQLSLGCTRYARSCSNGYNPNSTMLYLGHFSTVRNHLFLKSQTVQWSYGLHKTSASGEKLKKKKVRVVSLARGTPTGPPLHPYQT